MVNSDSCFLSTPLNITSYLKSGYAKLSPILTKTFALTCVKAVRDVVNRSQRLLVHFLGFAAFPKDPEIQLSGPLEVGKPVMVKCLVPDVYPSDRLEVDLFKGDHLLKTQMFLEAMEKKSLVTKTMEVTLTPDIEDTGKALICKAKLHTDSETKERETVEELQLYSKYFHDEL